MADRYGYVLDASGNRLLPITHINLVVGNDGRTIGDAFYEMNNKLINAQTYDDLLSLDTTSLVYGSIGYVIDADTYYSYTSSGWRVMTTGSSGGDNSGSIDSYSHIIISAEEPAEDQRKHIWIDTSSDGIVESPDDVSLLYSLLEQVKEMQNTIISLNKRIKYLEENGVIVNPNPPVDTDEDDFILLEDGATLLFEDGSEVLLEVQVVDPKPETGDNFLFEDGSEILLEDGSTILLENIIM